MWFVDSERTIAEVSGLFQGILSKGKDMLDRVVFVVCFVFSSYVWHAYKGVGVDCHSERVLLRLARDFHPQIHPNPRRTQQNIYFDRVAITSRSNLFGLCISHFFCGSSKRKNASNTIAAGVSAK